MTTSVPPLRLAAREPADLVAAALVSLGFEPEESLVMLTFGAPRTFHARVDLPDPEADLGELCTLADLLLRPALEHGVERVALLQFTESGRVCDRLAALMAIAFHETGIEVVVQGWVGGGLLRPVLEESPDLPWEGVPVDPRSHRFLAETVLAGHHVYGSRADLAELIAPAAPAVVTGVRVALDAAAGPPPAGRALRALVRAEVAALTAGERRPDDATVAELLRGIAGCEGRRVAWCARSRAEARRHADLWAEVLRRAPEGSAVGPAVLLALAAAYAGDGALAWCALDRAAAARTGAEGGGRGNDPDLDHSHRHGHHRDRDRDDDVDREIAVIASAVSAAVPPERFAPEPTPWLESA